MSDTYALDAQGLEVEYRSATVLKGLSVQVRQGEIYALLGGNGAGKSTTINAFLGFIHPTRGSVSVCGLDAIKDSIAVRRKLAYIPENVALYEHLSARENIVYFLKLAQSPHSDKKAIEEAFDAVKLDVSAWDRPVSGFSKGMRQKVAIALALARSVPVLLLDEPTTGLDPQATAEFNRLLQVLRGRGVAIFMVTHDLLSAVEVADRIGFLHAGKIDEELAASGPERFDLGLLHKKYSLGQAAA